MDISQMRTRPKKSIALTFALIQLALILVISGITWHLFPLWVGWPACVALLINLVWQLRYYGTI